jgi:hypothetical protein
MKDQFVNLISGPARLVQASIENVAKQKLVELLHRDGGGMLGARAAERDEAIRVGMDAIRDGLYQEAKRLELPVMDKLLREKAYLEFRQQYSGGDYGGMGELDPQVLMLTPRTRGRGVARMLGIGRGNVQERATGRLDKDGNPEMVEVPEKPILGATIMRGGQKPKGHNIMSVMYKGEPRYYELFDELLLRSVKAMRRDFTENSILRAFNWVRRRRQELVTLDPTFMLRNASRDLPMAAIMTKTGTLGLVKRRHAPRADGASPARCDPLLAAP